VFLFEQVEGPLKIQDTNNASVGGAVVRCFHPVRV
jgi:hypothetical protein